MRLVGPLESVGQRNTLLELVGLVSQIPSISVDVILFIDLPSPVLLGSRDTQNALW
jgi:hypothetical protein